MDGGRLQPSRGHDNKCYGATAAAPEDPGGEAPSAPPKPSSIPLAHLSPTSPQQQQQETSFSTPQISLSQGGRQNEAAVFENSYANQYGAMEGREEGHKTEGVGLVPEQMECCEGEEASEPCGWGPVRLACCNALRSPKVVLLCLCCASALQVMCPVGNPCTLPLGEICHQFHTGALFDAPPHTKM